MQVAYKAGYENEHPMRPSMLEDFRSTVLRLWPLEDLTDLGVAPTNYINDEHAFAFLPFGVTQEASSVPKRRMMSGLIIPMVLEDREWQVDLPGWRFFDQDS